MDQTATETPAAPKRRRRVWIVGGAVTGVALIVAGLWFLFGNKIWTDGGAIRVADRDTRIREVLWARPQPLEGFSSDEHVYEPSVSPDGTELYFVRGKAGRGAHVYVSHRKRNAWSKPEPVEAVNGEFDTLGPRVTPDGNYLLFYSDRPGGLGGYDIWASPRTGDGWAEPFNLGPGVNSEFNEFNPDPTPDGKRLIFATNRKAAKREQNEAWRSTIRETVSSDYDLWIADIEPTRSPVTQPTTQPEAASELPNLAFHAAREIAGINTPYTEGASCMSPAGDFLYFSSNRPGGQGKFDIYRCRVHGDQFGAVENVGPAINTTENEADPALAFNGFRMIFSSDRTGADGRYQLLASDSREVYPEHIGHPMPHLGWSAWLLIASLLILIPLLMFLRGWDEHRLSIIQKALLLSLLVHALITFAMSFVVVTQNVTQYVRKEMGLEIAVNLKEAQGLEEGLAIRSQVSGDLPTGGAEPAALQASRTVSEAAAPAATDLDVPTARIKPGGMAIPVEAPKPVAAAAQQQAPQASVADASTQDAIDVKLPTAQGVSQTEAQPQVAGAQSALERAAPQSTSAVTPRQVGVNAVPIARPVAQSAAAMEAPSGRAGMVGGIMNDVKPLALAASGAVEDRASPRMSATKVAAAEQNATPAAQAPGLSQRPIQGTASGPSTVAPAETSIVRDLPKAAVSGGPGVGAPQPKVELAAATGTTSIPAPGDIGGSVAAPNVKVVTDGVRQSAAEPSPAKPIADSTASARGPLQSAKDQGPAVSAPRGVQLSERPVPATAGRADLTGVSMAPVPNGLRGDAGIRVGREKLPQADSGDAVVRPQISVGSAASVAARQAASESQPVFSSSAASGPTTQPVQIASGSEAVRPSPAAQLPSGDERIAARTSGDSGISTPALATAAKLPHAEPGDSVSSPSAVDQIAAPNLASTIGSDQRAGRISVAGEPAAASDAVAIHAPRASLDGALLNPANLNVAAGPVQAKATIRAGNAGGVRAAGPTLASAQVPGEPIAPQIDLVPISGTLGPGKLAMPDTPFMRAPEQRKPLLEKMGGTKQSEDAVARGLAYLARVQEPDGRWTRVEDDRRPGRRHKDRHDMACTGFSLLAFLAQDHRPDKPGPYREVVSKAVDYLITMQDDDGDLRGPPEFRGGGSDAANMYDQGIATYALAECAIMTRDPKVIDAAMKGAAFIVKAQDRSSGGWRYTPQEYGDSSVFGWQIMALHSAEQVGFEIPQETLDGAKRYLASCEEGKHGLLAGYQPHTGATPTMTAELLFCRMLLDMPLSDDGMREATRFLAHQPPEARNADMYYWYYASLSMLHMNNPLWKDWNVLTRESLIRMQQQDGPSAGCWEGDSRWAQRGGRVFSTAMATLTLEVYYRYLPLRKNVEAPDEQRPDDR